MMQGEWMGSWGTGFMGGGLWMVLVVVLVAAVVIAILRKR